MTFRERVRVSDVSGDYLTHPGGVYLSTVTRRRREEYMLDTIGNRSGNNPVTHTKAYVDGNIVNGAKYGVRALNVPGLADVAQLSNMSIDEGRFSESREALATRHLAGAAPNKPAVNLPETIGELLAGRMEMGLRGVGLGKFSYRAKQDAVRRGKKPPPYGEVGAAFDAKYPHAVPATPYGAAKKAADDYLAYQFGAVPFLSDLRQLADLASAFHKRKREIENLKNGGSSKRWDLGTGSYRDEDSGDGGYSVYPFGYMPTTWSYTKTVERKIYSRWKINENSPVPQTDADVVKELLGLTVQGFTLAAWELVPWSWLVDYFTTMGNFLHGSMNSILYEVSGGFMYTVTYEESNGSASYYYGPDDYCSITPARLSKKLFVRVPGLPIPSITWSSSFLDGRQLSILGALGVTRA